LKVSLKVCFRHRRARFNEPAAVALDADGTLYVADQENRVVRSVRDGVVATLAGSGENASTDGLGVAAAFRLPNSISLCAAKRRLYVGDRDVVRVVELPPLADAVPPPAPLADADPPRDDARPPAAAPTDCVWCAPRAPAPAPPPPNSDAD